MKLKNLIITSLILISGLNLFAQNSGEKENLSTSKITFIELGSVHCIPCQKMTPILEKIKKKYSNEVDVIFYDVWTPAGKPYAQQYGIRAIPTQVFLDENGVEFFRHTGYFPEEEVMKVLRSKNKNLN